MQRGRTLIGGSNPPTPKPEPLNAPQAFVLRDRLRAIIPSVDVDARVSMFTAAHADDLLALDGEQSVAERCFVLDCIDDLVTKAELIAACSKRGLRVLSSMGAGLKADPTRLHIANLADCQKDRLAMRVRWLAVDSSVQSSSVEFLHLSCFAFAGK